MSLPQYGSNPITTVTPKGLSCAAIGQFVVIADAENPFNVRWCAIGNPTSWPTPNTSAASSVQAGEQTMSNRFGIVTAVSGGDFFGYVFQERGITKMTYVGGDVVFAFDTFEETRGCIAYNRRVAVDDTIFFQSAEGYHALANDQVADIGFGVVNDSYPPLLAGSVPDSQQRNVVANPAIGTVIFEDKGLCYNYKTGQFTVVDDLSSKILFSINDADGIIGEVIVGSTYYAMQDQSNGSALTATLETAESDLNQGGRTVVDGVRPLINGGTVAVSVGVRNDLDDAVTYSTGTSINSRTGKANFRSAAINAEGRYQRVKLEITGGFETALGADVEYESSGGV